MNYVTFRGGETAGSIGETTGSIGETTAKQETAGSIGARIYQDNFDVQLKSLDKDTVAFKGANKKESSPLGTIACIGGVIAGLVVGLGCAKKYNWVDKISHKGFKDFVVKYGTDPCYNACKSVKTFAVDNYNKIAGYIKK